jgi:hypothetical protein
MNELIQALEADGLTVTVTKLRGVPTKHRKSLWGVKSRVSGTNRKGQVAHGVGSMDSNQLMRGNQSMCN